MRSSGKSRLPMIVAAVAAVLWLAFPQPTWAQGTGGVSGTVTRSDDRGALAGVIVVVKGTAIRTVTNTTGRYTLERVPAGPATLEFRWVGYSPRELPVTITAGSMTTLDASLDPLPVTLSEIMVSGASRSPERVTQAPSAISSVDPRAMVTTSPFGQAPLALRNVPGVDLTQSGLTDFNVNARGFNSTLNRRVLVLQDGRDLAIAFLGSQEWNTLAQPSEDFSKMEFVSGPGSALYGANAYSGVLDITTPAAREVLGTKVTLAGGVLGTDGDWNGGSPGSYRGDLRHAGTFSEGRYGYRFNFGLSSSDTWSRSRTTTDSLSIRREYEPVYCSDLSEAECTAELEARVPKTGPERLALRGQTIASGTGEATGDRDPIKTYYGSARFDIYAANGNVATFEGGYANVQNEVFVTGIGRVQVYDASRPWGRFEYAATGYNVMAYWNGRRTNEPQFSLASTAPLRESSDIFHIEAQANISLSNDRGRLVYGGSVRNLRIDTDTTLMIARDDDRSDYMYAGYAQFSWQLAEKVRVVVAGRFDLGSQIDPQFSPKAALVVNPSPNHSLRFTVNQAFQTPNYSEFYLRAAAGIANLALLEAGLRASPLGPALAGVPVGQLFACSVYTTPCAASSSAVPVNARGNSKLDVEKNTGYEVGWRGDLSRRLFASVDAYYNKLSNFVTDLLPGVNPAFPFWTAPSVVPEPARAPLEAAVRNALLANPASRVAGLGLTRQETGNTAIVLSYGNSGNADQYGVDVGMGFQATDEIRLDLSGSWFDYDTENIATGDQLLANTPEWRGNAAANYTGRGGLDLGFNYRYSSGFPWAAGVFVGEIEPGHTFDANAGYRISPKLRLFVAGTNLINRQWFSIYGGSVNGRRVMGGITATF